MPRNKNVHSGLPVASWYFPIGKMLPFVQVVTVTTEYGPIIINVASRIQILLTLEGNRRKLMIGKASFLDLKGHRSRYVLENRFSVGCKLSGLQYPFRGNFAQNGMCLESSYVLVQVGINRRSLPDAGCLDEIPTGRPCRTDHLFAAYLVPLTDAVNERTPQTLPAAVLYRQFIGPLRAGCVVISRFRRFTCAVISGGTSISTGYSSHMFIL